MAHKNICFGLAAARGMITSTGMEAGNILWWDRHSRAAAFYLCSGLLDFPSSQYS